MLYGCLSGNANTLEWMVTDILLRSFEAFPNIPNTDIPIPKFTDGHNLALNLICNICPNARVLHYSASCGYFVRNIFRQNIFTGPNFFIQNLSHLLLPELFSFIEFWLQGKMFKQKPPVWEMIRFSIQKLL